MKIYTEVNYIWKDDKLVQTDSKSFDYEGEVESCHWYHSHGGGTLNKIATKAKDEYKGSDLEKGISSGLGAAADAYDKAKKDNPNPNLNVQTPDKVLDKGRDAWHDAMDNLTRIWRRNLPSYGSDDHTTTPESNPNTLLEDLGPGSRATAGGGKYGASGKSTAGRRGIEKKHAKSLINQQLQKRLPA